MKMPNQINTAEKECLLFIRVVHTLAESFAKGSGAALRTRKRGQAPNTQLFKQRTDETEPARQASVLDDPGSVQTMQTP